jgi:hypothetical protein
VSTKTPNQKKSRKLSEAAAKRLAEEQERRIEARRARAAEYL